MKEKAKEPSSFLLQEVQNQGPSDYLIFNRKTQSHVGHRAMNLGEAKEWMLKSGGLTWAQINMLFEALKAKSLKPNTNPDGLYREQEWQG